MGVLRPRLRVPGNDARHHPADAPVPALPAVDRALVADGDARVRGLRGRRGGDAGCGGNRVRPRRPAHPAVARPGILGRQRGVLRRGERRRPDPAGTRALGRLRRRVCRHGNGRHGRPGPGGRPGAGRVDRRRGEHRRSRSGTAALGSHRRGGVGRSLRVPYAVDLVLLVPALAFVWAAPETVRGAGGPRAFSYRRLPCCHPRRGLPSCLPPRPDSWRSPCPGCSGRSGRACSARCSTTRARCSQAESLPCSLRPRRSPR